MGRWRRNRNKNYWNKSNSSTSNDNGTSANGGNSRSNSTISNNDNNMNDTNGEEDESNNKNKWNTNYTKKSNIVWNWKDRNDLNQYLQNYRHECIRLYNEYCPDDSSLVDSEKSEQMNSSHNSDNRRGTAIVAAISSCEDESTANSNDNGDNVVVDENKIDTNSSGNDTHVRDDVPTVWIGHHAFPALYSETNKEFIVFHQPYLRLPSSLNSKERRMVHELCLENNLYHETVPALSEKNGGSNGSDVVQIVISIYCDGFETLLPIKKQQLNQNNCVRLYQYQPWYYRYYSPKENNVFLQQNEIETLRSIDALIDQPSQCIRSCDVIDYTLMENVTLASINITKNNGTITDDVDDNWMLVDSVDKMKQCIMELKDAFYGTTYNEKATELAFDVECYNPSKYTQITCLLQLTTNCGKEYVIDTLASPELFTEIGTLQPFFADPEIVKIGHSVGGVDAKCLYRDFGISIQNLFDTYESAQILRLPSHSLIGVCDYYGLPSSTIQEFRTLKETYQKCDWTVRPLNTHMIQYGRYDARYLIPIRQLMMRDLTQTELYQHPLTNGDKDDARNDDNDDDENHLVAKSLAVTLAQFDQADNDDDEFFNTTANVDSKNLADIDMIRSNKEEVASDLQQLAASPSNQSDDTPTALASVLPDQNDTITLENESEVLLATDDHQNGYTTPIKEKSIENVVSFKRSDTMSTTNENMFMTPTNSFDESDDDDDDHKIVEVCVDTENKHNIMFDRSYENDDDEQYETPSNIPTTIKKSNVSRNKIRNPSIQNSYNNNTSKSIATPDDLRLQPRLMSVLSNSQERCKDIWYGHKMTEPFLKSPSFLAMIQRSKMQQQDQQQQISSFPQWNTRSTELYHKLAQWRDTVCRQLQCLPGFVVSLQYLVAVAWKCPVNEDELRLIQYILPPILEDNEQYRNDLLIIVMQSNAMRNDEFNNDRDIQNNNTPTQPKILYRYSELQNSSALHPRLRNNKRETITSKEDDDATMQSSSWKKVVTVATAFTICAGIVTIILIRRSRRR